MTKYFSPSNINLGLAIFLATDNYDSDYSIDTYSATTLIKPIREIVLRNRIEPNTTIVDVTQLVMSKLGSAFHDGIQAALENNLKGALKDLRYPPKVYNNVYLNPSDEYLKDNPKTIPIYSEQRRKKEITINGRIFTITGKFDSVINGGVSDYKVTSAWSYQNGAGDKNYQLQGSIYRWLASDIITKDHLEIHFIIRDYKAFESYKKNYPSADLAFKKYNLISESSTETFITSKLHEVIKYENAPEADLPFCNDEQLWRRTNLFKYYANPAKTEGNSTKNFESQTEAYAHLHEKGNKGVIKEVKGKVIACKYCSAFNACTQKDIYLNDGTLTL